MVTTFDCFRAVSVIVVTTNRTVYAIQMSTKCIKIVGVAVIDVVIVVATERVSDALSSVPAAHFFSEQEKQELHSCLTLVLLLWCCIVVSFVHVKK